MLLDRERQRDRPERLPISLGLAHSTIFAVAHQVGIGARLVDQGALGEHRAVALPHRLALGLEQQRLAEALGRDDQHLLGGRGIEEVGDLVVEMQELTAELIEILRLDVLRIDHPRFHLTPSTRRPSRHSSAINLMPFKLAEGDVLVAQVVGGKARGGAEIISTDNHNIFPGRRTVQPAVVAMRDCDVQVAKGR
jgi:hypothetical protein